MKHYESKVVEVHKDVQTHVTCDKCGKDIRETEHDFYFEVTTGHERWGNDSIESIEHKDFCSFHCVVNDLANYYIEADDTYRYEIEQVRKSKSEGTK